MKLHIRLMFLLFMLCALFVSTRAACSAEEAKEVKASDVWEKVYEYDGPVGGGEPIWCGKDALVVRDHDLTKEVGGYVYVNLVTKEQFWITKDIYDFIGGCSYDGSTAFLYKYGSEGNEDGSGDPGYDSEDIPEFLEGSVSRWVYDIKTGNMYDYGGAKGVLHNKMMRNASPTAPIYADLTGMNDYKDRWGSCKVNLPTGWKILCITPDEFKLRRGAYWSNDGSYIMLSKAGLRFVAYDNTGVKIGSFEMGSGNGKPANTELRSWLLSDPIAMSDGVYYFKEDGILRRVNVPSGKIDVLPVKVIRNKGGLFAFDVSVTNKEVAYTNAGRNELDDAYVAMFGGKTTDYDLSETGGLSGRHELGGLYVAMFDGKTTYQLSETGALAKYSHTGEYIAFHEHGPDRENIFVVYKRKKQVNKN